MLKIIKDRVAKTTRPTIYYFTGIPGSGKSSKAKSLLKTLGSTALRFNKDDIREMMGDPTWSYEVEAAVNAAVKSGGVKALELGFDIIVDDSGFNSYHTDYWQDYAKNHNLNLIIYFVDTDLATCKSRCTARGGPVTPEVVMTMHDKYIQRINELRKIYTAQNST